MCSVDKITVAFDKYSDDNLSVLSVPVEKMNGEKARLQFTANK